MDKSILMQKQVRDNAEDLQKEFLDMKNWEEQMKHKDEQLRKEASGQIVLPPIRRKHKSKTKGCVMKKDENNAEMKRIKSYDYSAWDKFDADKACKEVDKEEQSNESEDERMSKEELKRAHEEATKHKNEGNIFVQQQNWSKAIGCYSNAIKLFPYDAVFYANRALCQLKLNNFYAAESDSSAAIQLDDSYVKAYHRRAIARMNIKQYKEAKRDLEKALKLEPSNKEVKLLQNQIENKLKCSEASTVKKDDAQQSTIEKEGTKEITIEKKIADKMWNNSAKVQSTKTKNIIKPKHMKENKVITNVKDSIENRKDDMADTNIKKKRDSRIPDWLPEKDEVTVIEPIEKPPHLRSKKPLTKIPIQELEFGIEQYKYTNLVQKTDCVEEEPNKDSVQIEEFNKKCIQMENISFISPVPKTAVQFLMNWRKNNLLEFRYEYLKQLPENSLPKIFQDSMESDIFSQIIEILSIEFIKRKDQIFRYLKDLSQVKRFRALIMFITNSDKKNLRTLFEYCKTVENVSQDEISILKDKYEI
ncbi:RNA polymerase II-associated protein 3 [Melipona quadrifasciata]|uniref:RNA polymerase II-associated protein 3 n=1 Tax=Melipona quadrifasciata TaxID=166423 RepID=A0A0N0U5U3_9HYME|nr:RNA polymerase II-associated protein 3 [Melipona quadrifasciata]